jgi:hypothetical protein
MDLSKIKQKLEELNQEKQAGTENAKYFWTPPLGKTTIRIVPSKYDVDSPFTELYFHNVISKFPILALTNFGQQDPVEEFRKTLQEAGGKDNWSMSGKLTPRPRYYAPVIVRGEEDKGVRLWNFGVSMYKTLLQLAAEEEIGDYTDVKNGIDLVITKVNGNPYPETSIMAKRQNSPLSTDPKQVEDWLENQPKPIECFKKADYAYIKKQLETYVSGAPATTTEEPAEKNGESEENPAPKAEKPAAPKTGAAKQPPHSVVSKFDDIFDDGDDEAGEDDLFKEN